jgi:hypothetical protein
MSLQASQLQACHNSLRFALEGRRGEAGEQIEKGTTSNLKTGAGKIFPSFLTFITFLTFFSLLSDPRDPTSCPLPPPPDVLLFLQLRAEMRSER